MWGQALLITENICKETELMSLRSRLRLFSVTFGLNYFHLRKIESVR